MKSEPSTDMQYQVRSSDTDARDCLHLPALGALLQETASIDADRLGWGIDMLEREQVGWVLIRLSIRMTVLPRWRETLRVQTWPRGREKLLFYRDYRMYSDGPDPVGQATSTWVLIDQKTRRPCRPDRLDPDGFHGFSGSDTALPYNAVQIREQEMPADPPLLCVTAEYGDIDRNGHVTNTRYIAWCLDALVRLTGSPVRVTGLDINYLAEILHGQQVEVYGIEQTSQEVMLVGKTGAGATTAFRAVLHMEAE